VSETGKQTQPAGNIHEGWVSDTDAKYSEGWTFISGRNLAPSSPPKSPEQKLQERLAASEIQIGSYPLLDLMKYLKIPLSREHYLTLEYGEVPVQLSLEQEAELPPEFRHRASPAEEPKK
jgi:hypothetical protein